MLNSHESLWIFGVDHNKWTKCGPKIGAEFFKKKTRIFAWNAGLPLISIAFGLTTQRIVSSLDVLVTPRVGNFKTLVLAPFFIRTSWILWKGGTGHFLS